MSEPASPGVQPAPASRRPSILLVDDEPSVLSALRRLFRPQGYEIVLAGSGAEALELMAELPADLVISDMRMPEMDGAALLETVRERYPASVRILLTGYADIGSTVAAINRGEIHRYIAKPWDDNDLLLVVSEALKRRDLERQNTELLALTQTQNQALQTLNQTLEARVASRTAELEQINGMLDQAYEEVKHNFTLALTVFSGLLEMRQDGIAGHSRRVAEIARRVALHLRLGEREQQDVYLAALLHDIGKIGFGDGLLSKPVSQYNAAELVRYRRHPLDGEAALMPLDKLHGVALIVRQHHERFDGRGFPDGLAGPAITLGARIVAAASDYDGLTNGTLAERTYTAEQARQALRDLAGSHHDPAVLAALTVVLAEIEADEVADTEVGVADLRPRMTLSRDLLSSRGAILLPAGFVFDERVIQKVRDLAARENLKVVLRVLSKSIPPAPAARAAPARALAG